MKRPTMHALVSARLNMKSVERRNAPNSECDAALDELAEVVGVHNAIKYQSAIRLTLQLEQEQLDVIDGKKV
jgi:predicted transcriptional regulator